MLKEPDVHLGFSFPAEETGGSGEISHCGAPMGMGEGQYGQCVATSPTFLMQSVLVSMMWRGGASALPLCSTIFLKGVLSMNRF